MGLETQKQCATARKRWGILAQALKNRKPDKNLDISVRRISSFDLIKITPISSNWFLYTSGDLNLKVHHLDNVFTPEDLIGFNNTGNICVWPAEEILAHYVILRTNYFNGKKIIELGGGMSSLAGLFIAKYSNAERVLLTDGNKNSVANVEKIIEKNNLKSKTVSCILEWGQAPKDKFDVVLVADCMFFDSTRKDLVKTMWNSLKINGTALVTAPKRGSTLDKFLDEAEQIGFDCRVNYFYDTKVWEKHLEMKCNSYYDPDIHYPVADYWKSQDKKFCDFCKCWIQDNKPSVQFHESGRRHQNNVQKRLDHIKRTANKQQKETARLDNEMKKIENAALLSYSRDISVNPDYSSSQIISQLQSSGQNLADILPLTRSTRDPMLPYKPQQQQDKKKTNKKKKEKKKKPVWYEAISPEGYTYYWHSESQQSVWEPPKQFISIKMQEMIKQQEVDRKKEEEEREKAFFKAQREIEEAKLRQEAARNGVDFDMERRAWLKREEMKKYRRPEIKKPQETSVPGPIIEPSRTDPYGTWTTIKRVEPKPINLQLPKINTDEVVEITLPPEQTEMHIEEKTVESLKDEDDIDVPSSFKKRKTNRGNMRQRNEEEND